MSILVPQKLTSNDSDEDSGIKTQNDHLSNLKALAKKLHLDIKRPSYLEWRCHLESQRSKDLKPLTGAKERHIRAWTSVKWTRSLQDPFANKGQNHPPDRLKSIGSVADTLEWLRKELKEMQIQDQQLALQLLCLHQDLNKLKIEQVCKQHQKMINDATFELEERDDLLDLLCDFPITSVFSLSTPLKLIGITKMNVSSRRFSLS